MWELEESGVIRNNKYYTSAVTEEIKSRFNHVVLAMGGKYFNYIKYLQFYF